MVDEFLATVSTTGSNIHLDLDGLLYLGGVRRNMFESLPKSIASKAGFEGCLASLDVNGELVDPSGTDALIPSTLVESGCTGSSSKCTTSACANRGICIQLWNTYACDCSMTSYSGPNCAEDSTAYRFGPKSGLIKFDYVQEKRADTKNDLLAVGFMSSQENAVLVRIDSSSSSDYMELQLVDGALLMVYNLGMEDLDVGHLGLKVNDNRYHIVRFTRSGPNTTLQVDNHNVQTRQPSGKQLTIFNTQSRIQIGGKKSTFREHVIEKPFVGILSGLVFNDDKILDFAAEKDQRVAIEGDVELLLTVPIAKSTSTTTNSVGTRSHVKVGHYQNRTRTRAHQMQQNSKKGIYDGDEIILSGDGSGCWDDEDCASLATSSGDDLITPFLSLQVSTTASPRRMSTVAPLSIICDEDDEDCIEGSASGESVPDVRNPLPLVPPSPAFSWPSPPGIYATTSKSTLTTSTTTTDSYEDNSILYTFKPIPPPDPPPTYESYRPKPPPRPTGRPVIVDVPKVQRYNPQLPRDLKQPTATNVHLQGSADKTAMIIGLIAVIIIIIVIVAPLILFLKVRYRNNNVAGEEKNQLRFAGVTATPPQLRGHHGADQLVSQTLLDGSNNSTPAKQRPLNGQNGQDGKRKDHKEWYV